MCVCVCVCVCVTKPFGVYLEKAMKVQKINTTNNPMEKTHAAEKNRTPDNMCVEKKKRGGGGGRKKGEVLRTERSPMMC